MSQGSEVRLSRIQLNMEGALTARDRVGIQDFVLLDSYTSESAFLDNLRKRFRENLIYVNMLRPQPHGTQECHIHEYSEKPKTLGLTFQLEVNLNVFDVSMSFD